MRLADLPLEDFRQADAKLDEGIYEVLGAEHAVAAMTSYGSTGPEQVKQQIARWKALLDRTGNNNMRDIVKQHGSVHRMLDSVCGQRADAGGGLPCWPFLAWATSAIAQEGAEGPGGQGEARPQRPTERRRATGRSRPGLPPAGGPGGAGGPGEQAGHAGRVFAGGQILADLQRPDLAKILLKKVLDANPTEAATGRTGRTVRRDHVPRPGLAAGPCPEARQLADAVVAANNRQLQDPKRLAGLIKQLQDPPRTSAHRRLPACRTPARAGVEALVAALAAAAEAEPPAPRRPWSRWAQRPPARCWRSWPAPTRK